MTAAQRERTALSVLQEAEKAHEEARVAWRKADDEAHAEAAAAFRAKPTPEALVYAAWSRCPCGAGLAYAKHEGVRGAWDCSAILLGTADPKVEHTDRLPFAFYDVKSEIAASAKGATTRPDGN